VAATVAGVIGAAAAVYPFFRTDQQLLHLTLVDKDFLQAEAFSEPVVLTGNWHIRRLRRWWWNEVVLDGRDDRATHVVWSFKDRRVRADADGSTLVTELHGWSGAYRCEGSTPGEFEFGLEFKSRAGLAWAYIVLPYCVLTPQREAARAKAAEEVRAAEAKANREFWAAEAAKVDAEIKARAEARAAEEEAKARAEEEAAKAARVRADAEAATARGDAFVAKGDYRRAVDEYTDAIKIDGSLFAAFFKRGDAYFALGQKVLAMEDYRASFRLRCSTEKQSWLPVCGESR
jgi:predicted negative regulator of RcsB-dependent stress response